MQRHCLTLRLRPDPDLVAGYIAHHQAVPPAIEQSLHDAGILRMQLFLQGTGLIMLLDTTDSFSFERKAQLDAANPAVLAWENLMARFQDVGEGDDPVRRWQPAKLIYDLAGPA